MKLYNYKDGSQAWLDDAEYKDAKRGETLLEIADCKALLTSTDYKVTKNAECLALGLELPYNAEELHKERQALRDKINALEKEL